MQTNTYQPATVLQWDEPYDQEAQPDHVLPAAYTGTGTGSSSTGVTKTIPATLTAGTL